MVEINNISLTYPSGNRCLKNISLSVAPGECVLLTGKSGSGKSSLIRALNGLALHYDNAQMSGDICINGQSVAQMEIYQIAAYIASVFQNPKTHFFNVDTTLELVFYLENMGVSRASIAQRLEEVLTLFPIEHLLDRDIFRLSGGEKQVLSIAAAYISGAPIIVLDEPSSNLDERYTAVLAEMLAVLKARGITLIIAEYRLDYLMASVDRIYLLENGQISASYTCNAFLELSNTALQEKGLRPVVAQPLQVSPAVQGAGELYIDHLDRCFKGTDRGIAVRHIGLTKGRIYGIIGRNGCGKSTFMRALLGLEGRRRDALYLDSKPVSKGRRLTLSALVMQDVNHQLFSDTVVEEVSLGIAQPDPSARHHILDRLGLSALANRHPMSLSGGEKQRVVIASALLSKRPIIGFDEPTSGMDYENMVRISDLIKETAATEKIILIISHDTAFLNKTADYIIDMETYLQ